MRRKFQSLIYIYSDSQIVELDWLPKLALPSQYEIVHSIDQLEQIDSDQKLAFVAHRLHCQYDENLRFEDKVRRLSSTCKLVFCIESELHQYHWSIWSYCHRENVYWVLPGLVNDRESMSRNIIFWGDWFKTTTGLYKDLPEVLSTIEYRDVKPKFFDALLGSPKPHRTFVAEAVKENQLQDKVVLTYGGKWSNKQFYAKDYFIYEPGTQVMSDQHIGTMDWALYHGKQCHLSQIIPVSVFNDTAYSIIAETDYDNTLSFFTEKTAKALIAKRLFVVYSGYKFLANLRSLGFKTFDSVIDESYDLMLNGQERYQAAFQQIKYLCSQPQKPILEKIQSIVEHNHNLIMTTDWTKRAADHVQQVIDNNL